MLMRPGLNIRRYLLGILAVVFLVINVHDIFAQTGVQSTSGDVAVVVSEPAKTTAEPSTVNKKLETTEEKLNALEQILERQSQRLDRLQETIVAQRETIRLLASKLNLGETPT